MESVSHMSPELRQNVRLGKDLEPTDDTGKGVHQTEFVEVSLTFSCKKHLNSYFLTVVAMMEMMEAIINSFQLQPLSSHSTLSQKHPVNDTLQMKCTQFILK